MSEPVTTLDPKSTGGSLPPDATGALLGIVGEVARELHPARRAQAATLDSRLDRDLGIDSLGRAELIARIERTFAITLPISALLLLAAAYLVRRLPRMPFEESNALVERLPGWSAGFAYSMFLMTGGRLGDRLVNDLVAHVIERRLQRVHDAPLPVGEFLAFHFRGAEADLAWLHYLMREALVFGNRPVPQEDERQEAVSLQVQEIRDRQAAGLLPAVPSAGRGRDTPIGLSTEIYGSG